MLILICVFKKITVHDLLPLPMKHSVKQNLELKFVLLKLKIIIFLSLTYQFC